MPLGPQRLPITMGAAGFSASGGTETTATVDGQAYKFHTFTTSSTFQVKGKAHDIAVFIVGGGGGSGSPLEQCRKSYHK